MIFIATAILLYLADDQIGAILKAEVRSSPPERGRRAFLTALPQQITNEELAVLEEEFKEAAGCYDSDTGLLLKDASVDPANPGTEQLDPICHEEFSWESWQNTMGAGVKTVAVICIGCAVFMALRCLIDVFNFIYPRPEHEAPGGDAESGEESDTPAMDAFLETLGLDKNQKHIHKYQWSEAFDHLDKDKSGALSLDELRGLVALDSQKEQLEKEAVGLAKSRKALEGRGAMVGGGKSRPSRKPVKGAVVTEFTEQEVANFDWKTEYPDKGARADEMQLLLDHWARIELLQVNQKDMGGGTGGAWCQGRPASEVKTYSFMRYDAAKKES